MISAIREWWKHLGYSWRGEREEFRTYGIRPWRGAPFLWFVIDRSHTVTQSKKHKATCDSCRASDVPTPKEHRPDSAK